MHGTCTSCTRWHILLLTAMAFGGCCVQGYSVVAALPWLSLIMWVAVWLDVCPPNVKARPPKWVIVLAQRLAACHAIAWSSPAGARLGSLLHQ